MIEDRHIRPQFADRPYSLGGIGACADNVDVTVRCQNIDDAAEQRLMIDRDDNPDHRPLPLRWLMRPALCPANTNRVIVQPVNADEEKDEEADANFGADATAATICVRR